jgi:hypothetical protein
VKYPISLNQEELDEISELARILGQIDKKQPIGSVYGALSKTMKWSISFALETIKQADKDIPQFSSDKLDIFLSSIKRMRELKNISAQQMELAKKAESV